MSELAKQIHPLLTYEKVERGIPYLQFIDMSFPDILTLEDWADILELSERTLANYKKDNKQFKSLQSEKIYEINELLTHGLDTFGNKQKLISWLESKRTIFNDKTPKDLLRNSYGIRFLQSELHAIDHGIFA